MCGCCKPVVYRVCHCTCCSCHCKPATYTFPVTYRQPNTLSPNINQSAGSSFSGGFYTNC